MSKTYSKGFIVLSDIYIAYRKAKSESFFDNLHPCAIAFTQYEQNLKSNLQRLFKLLTNPSSNWEYDPDLIGGYLFVPKSIDESAWVREDEVHFRLIDPMENWGRMYSESGHKRLTAKYRQIITPSIDYQIISALWIIKAGHIYESALNDDYVYGNKLRRTKDSYSFYGFSGSDINVDSLGLFSPYFTGYQKWRENGLAAMKDAISRDKSITAITMDLAGFYHNVSPRFMLRRSFLDKIRVTLSRDQELFTSKLITSIDTWYRNTPDYENRREGSLPVGLSASKIISNVLLIEFDEEVLRGLKPIYYGRYVDDIFIVVNNHVNHTSGKEVLRWLCGEVKPLKIIFKKNEMPELAIRFPYASDSNLTFTPSKQKIFSLSGDHGLDLVDQISSQIRSQGSEYRLLPDVPYNSTQMAEKTLLATSDATLAADALRKADAVSIKRLGFSLLLRDIEQYSKDLRRSHWKQLRNEFYGLVDRYLLSPKGLFEFYSYFPRVFKIMIANYDFSKAIDFIQKLELCIDLIEITTKYESHDDVSREGNVRDYFSKVLIQAAMQAATTRNYNKWTDLGRVIRRIRKVSDRYIVSSGKLSLQRLSANLLLADLGLRPYKDYWYYSQTKDISDVPVPRGVSIRKVLRLALIRRFRFAANLRMPHWPALAFPTRPLTIQEMAIIAPDVLRDKSLLVDSIKGLRGAGVWRRRDLGFYSYNDDYYLRVPLQKRESINIALSSIETTKQQYDLAIINRSDRSLSRYKRVCKIINDVLQSSTKVDYILMPEMSIPRRWAIGMAGKLASQGISFICGVEYYNYKKSSSTLRNDSLVSLFTRWPGYNSNIIYMQPKNHPAHFELSELRSVGKKLYRPAAVSESLPIYDHGGYNFGVIICSDLTNPANRARFEGKLDSLFVLEWNKDVKTFGFLIEGAAHDIHTFVVQVNNRMYGDSRIRAPYKQEYKRDSVRIKGGIEDYYVLANIPYLELREFQSRASSPNFYKIKKKAIDSLFKPLPIGFKMSTKRRIN